MRSAVLPFLVCLFAPGLPAQEQAPLSLVSYGEDTTLRERLIRDSAVFADLGGRVVLRANAATLSGLRRNGVTCRSREVVVINRSIHWLGNHCG